MESITPTSKLSPAQIGAYSLLSIAVIVILYRMIYNITKEDFDFLKRSNVKIKGIGLVNTYLIT